MRHPIVWFVVAATAALAVERSAQAQTVGIEWELQHQRPGDFGGSYWRLYAYQDRNYLTEIDPDKLDRASARKRVFCTNDTVLVQAGSNLLPEIRIPRVAITYDQGMTTEIVTGPVVYNDQTEWNATLAQVDQFFQAADAIWTENQAATGRDIESSTGARRVLVPAEYLLTALEEISSNAWNDCGNTQESRGFGLMFTLVGKPGTPPSKFALGVDTQVNIELPLTAILKPEFENLYKPVGTVSVETPNDFWLGMRTRQKVLDTWQTSDPSDPIAKAWLVWARITDEVRKANKSESGVIKNLFGVFLKAKLADIKAALTTTDVGPLDAALGANQNALRVALRDAVQWAHSTLGAISNPIAPRYKPAGGQSVPHVVVETRNPSGDLGKALAIQRTGTRVDFVDWTRAQSILAPALFTP